MTALNTTSTSRLQNYEVCKEVFVVTLANALNIGETWTIAPIAKGAQILDVLVVSPAVASSTVSVGDTGSATRYLNAVSSASAGYLAVNTNTAITAGAVTAGRGYTYAANDSLVLTVGGANLSASTSLAVIVEFRRLLA
ncbi:MAG TPA: hypothetical protein VM639_00775 [Dongiaceae bacterium]|nr:hypothetical protein [Dongiaceae bacterium]